MNRAQAHELQREAAKLQARGGDISKVRMASVCRLCRRELMIVPQVRVNGRVRLQFRCSKHGALKPGEMYSMAYVATT